jgi:hypothetical protein
VETTPRDGIGKLITSSGLHLERCGPWIRMEASREYIVRIRRNKDKVIVLETIRCKLGGEEGYTYLLGFPLWSGG